MTKEFREFLKKNNAYENYIRCNDDESTNDFTSFDNFDWKSTKEGYDYWNDLDNKWVCICTQEDETTSKIYVYQYCIISGGGLYTTGFCERFDKLTSSKEALLFKISICEECGLDEKDCSLINLNIIGERDADSK